MERISSVMGLDLDGKLFAPKTMPEMTSARFRRTIALQAGRLASYWANNPGLKETPTLIWLPRAPW